MSLMVFNAFLRSWLTHHSKSSKPAESNSKLRTRVLQGDSARSLHGFKEALFHGGASEQVRGFFFGFEFPPQCDRDNDAGSFSFFVGDELDLLRCGHTLFLDGVAELNVWAEIVMSKLLFVARKS